MLSIGSSQQTAWRSSAQRHCRRRDVVVRASPTQEKRLGSLNTFVSSFRQTWASTLLNAQQALRLTQSRVIDALDTLAKQEAEADKALSEVRDQMASTSTQGFSDYEELPSGENGYAAPLSAANAVLGAPDTTDIAAPTLAEVMAAHQASAQEVAALQALGAELDGRVSSLLVGSDERDREGQALQAKYTQWAKELETKESLARAAALREQRRRALEAAAAAAEALERQQAEAEAEARRVLAERKAAELEQRQREEREAVEAAAAAAAAEAEAAAAAARAAALATVELRVQCATSLGQDVLLVGSHEVMGNWNVAAALPLAWSDGHVWRTTVQLPAGGGLVEYKAVVRNSNGSLVWERGDNKRLNLSGGDSVVAAHTFQW